MPNQLANTALIVATQLQMSVTGNISFIESLQSEIALIEFNQINYVPNHQNIYASSERLEEIKKVDQVLDKLMTFIEHTEETTEISINMNIAASKLRNRLILSCKQ